MGAAGKAAAFAVCQGFVGLSAILRGAESGERVPRIGCRPDLRLENGARGKIHRPVCRSFLPAVAGSSRCRTLSKIPGMPRSLQKRQVVDSNDFCEFCFSASFLQTLFPFCMKKHANNCFYVNFSRILALLILQVSRSVASGCLHCGCGHCGAAW
jgi:hypothetical protein